jgi:hypothetical protein
MFLFFEAGIPLHCSKFRIAGYNDRLYTERSWEFLTVLNENAEKHSIFIKSPGIISRDGYNIPTPLFFGKFQAPCQKFSLPSQSRLKN